MSGTVEGGKKAAATNKSKYGEDFYIRNGMRGGRISWGGGFTNNPDLARQAGRKGGRNSKRGATVTNILENKKDEVIGFSRRYSYKDTAAYFGVSYSTLRKFLKNKGVL